MLDVLGSLAGHVAKNGERLLFSDERQQLSRVDVWQRANALAAKLSLLPRVIGLLAPNSVEWAIGQLAAAMAGKLLVPLPMFFSTDQLAHIVTDAGVEVLLGTRETLPKVAYMGIPAHAIEKTSLGASADARPGFGQIIYTSGSTGTPKGVLHASGQLAWMAAALARATSASEADRYLSVLPLSLLLEAVCAILVPVVVGARTHFDRRTADSIGAADATGIAQAFEQIKPTTSVIVPQMLATWTAELSQRNARAPDSLRFVAVGGASVSQFTATRARQLGIPVFEGYGLSECASVVAVNRPEECKPGTVGRPLSGLRVTIDAGEVVVDGPSVMDGYLNGPRHRGAWRTGDLGSIDERGYLTIHGRKDNLLVTSFGRNVSPEWIETMLLGDVRILHCAITGHGQPELYALLIPSEMGIPWFERASVSDVSDLIDNACRSAPVFAVPKHYRVLSLADAVKAGLLTSNGRLNRARVAEFLR